MKDSGNLKEVHYGHERYSHGEHTTRQVLENNAGRDSMRERDQLKTVSERDNLEGRDNTREGKGLFILEWIKVIKTLCLDL